MVTSVWSASRSRYRYGTGASARAGGGGGAGRVGENFGATGLKTPHIWVLTSGSFLGLRYI